MTVLIVGAGPAGIAAAGVLAQHGVRPVLLDENATPGGQVWRRLRDEAALDTLLGGEAAHYRRIHAQFAALRPVIEYRPGTLAWAIDGGTLHIAGDGRAEALRFTRLILATGATDRTLPLPGWTLPGVFTLGGAQALLKGQGCAIGRRVVFCGASPLLYIAALQYVRMGVTVAAVLDTTPLHRKLMAAPRLLADARTLWRGVQAMAALRRRGVPIRSGVRLRQFVGEQRVQGVAFDTGGQTVTIGCDAVATGFGLKPETQLAELAGATLRFDPASRQFLPAADADGRCADALYVAGDGGAIGGADAAEASGALAAYAALADAGVAVDARARAALRREVQRRRRFQRGLADAFAWPAHWIAALPDATLLCRCEAITAGELREAVRRDLGVREVNRGKALTRCGMGRCQGRFCGLAAAELIAAEASIPLAGVGHLRAQAPVKPIARGMVGAA